MTNNYVEPITVTASPIRKNKDLDEAPVRRNPSSLKQPTRLNPSEGYDTTSHPGFDLHEAPKDRSIPRPQSNNPYYQTAKRPKDPYR